MATAGTAPTKLGDKRIRDLLMQYAVPAIIAMTASSLYNMVDSIYIGHIKDVGSYAISGLAVTFPLMNLATALGTLVGVGASTILSMLLGQKNYAVANKVLLNEVMLNVIIGGLFSVITLIFLDPILMFFGASQNTLPFARDYMVIILLGNVITHLYFGLNNIRNRKPHLILFHHDKHGIQPGNAAYCRLQFRCKKVHKSQAGIPSYGYLCDNSKLHRFLCIRVHSGYSGISLHK